MAVHLAVNGTLMRGLELNPSMIDAGAVFVRETTTAPSYRLWSIDDRHPAMVRVASGASFRDLWEARLRGVALAR